MTQGETLCELLTRNLVRGRNLHFKSPKGFVVSCRLHAPLITERIRSILEVPRPFHVFLFFCLFVMSSVAHHEDGGMKV